LFIFLSEISDNITARGVTAIVSGCIIAQFLNQYIFGLFSPKLCRIVYYNFSFQPRVTDKLWHPTEDSGLFGEAPAADASVAVVAVVSRKSEMRSPVSLNVTHSFAALGEA